MAVLALLLASCAATATGTTTATTASATATTTGDPTAFDWTLGVWHGTRRDPAGTEPAPLTMRVEPLLIGTGQIRIVGVRPRDGPPYSGTAVQQFDPATGIWLRQYGNSAARPPARYRAERADPADPADRPDRANGHRSVWRSITPGRSRESTLLSERLPDGIWRRTMSVSDDGGHTFRVLWIDELRRAP